jgi:hypothetical protein
VKKKRKEKKKNNWVLSLAIEAEISELCGDLKVGGEEVPPPDLVLLGLAQQFAISPLTWGWG